MRLRTTIRGGAHIGLHSAVAPTTATTVVQLHALPAAAASINPINTVLLASSTWPHQHWDSRNGLGQVPDHDGDTTGDLLSPVSPPAWRRSVSAIPVPAHCVLGRTPDSSAGFVTVATWTTWLGEQPKPPFLDLL